MSKTDQNKNVEKVRISDQLMGELRKVAGQALLRGEPAPSFGELLADAWRVYADTHLSQPQSNPINEPLKRVSTSGNGQVVECFGPGDLTPEEQEAVELLLLITRHGSETVKKAILWNLHGFAEPIKAKGAHGNDESAPITDFSETIKHLIESAEAVGNDEAARQRWLGDLKLLQAKYSPVRGKPKKAGGKHGPGRS